MADWGEVDWGEVDWDGVDWDGVDWDGVVDWGRQATCRLCLFNGIVAG